MKSDRLRIIKLLCEAGINAFIEMNMEIYFEFALIIKQYLIVLPMKPIKYWAMIDIIMEQTSI